MTLPLCASGELFAQINGGDTWMLVSKETNHVVSAFPSRDAARAGRNGDNTLKTLQFQSGETQIEIVKPAEEPAEVTMTAEPDDSIQGVVDATQAIGMNVTVIDENTDFSQLGNPFGTSTGRFPSQHVEEEEVEEEVEEEDEEEEEVEEDEENVGSGGTDGINEEQSEFAKDKETMEADPVSTVKAIDPKKEIKPPKVLMHKSTVEKPTRLVHAIADIMAEENPDVTRKEIIDACTQAGIAHYTILTQYQAWKAARS
jgi:hypothetical protein